MSPPGLGSSVGLPVCGRRRTGSVADWIGKFACVAAGIGIALIPQLVTRALPAGVTVLKLRDEQAPYRRVVAITDPRRQPSELTRMFIRLAKQAARH
jgi:DNA-binding transcriptional LysR family regulator